MTDGGSVQATWMSYLADERMVMVDARFEKQHPESHDFLYVVTAPMGSPGARGYGDEAEVARFERFEDELTAAAKGAGLIPVGRRRGFGAWEVAWYGPTGQERKLYKALKELPDGHLSTSADVEWEHYRTKLLPRGKDLHRARNGLVVYQLIQAGDRLDEPRLIEFFIFFHRDLDRDRYLRDIGSTGLDAAASNDGEKPGIRAFFTASVDVELITDITWELHERAVESNGWFDGWGCAPVRSS